MMSKDILLVKINALLSYESTKNIHDELVEQLKSGVVIIPAYFDAEILNVPDNVEVIIQPKDEELELELLNKPFHIKENKS